MHYTQPAVYELISKKTNDPIVEWKTCRVSGQSFAIYQSDLDFYRKMSGPLLKMGVKPPPTPPYQAGSSAIPTPTLCPEERQRRRLMFRNERKLYKRKCDATHQSLISIYSQDKPHRVYDRSYWVSDLHNAKQFGISFDFSVQFFEQLLKLQGDAPRVHNHIGVTIENSEYTNHGGYNKDCYMSFAINYSENCHYSRGLMRCVDVLDSLLVYDCQNCYQCVDCEQCSNTFFSQNSKNCSFSRHLDNCVGCSFCLGCIDLQYKKYYVFNNPVSEDQFNSLMSTYMREGGRSLLTQYYRLKQDRTCCTSDNFKSEHVVGNYLYHVKNGHMCFDILEGEDLRYCDGLYNQVSFLSDVSAFGNDIDQCYECGSVGFGIHQSAFCVCCWDQISRCYYCDLCIGNVKDCFGCVGLSNAQYCILNKQYTKQEYELLVPQIIEHMQETGERGEFFDPSLSPFGYNETVAQEYFPLTREEALVRGYTRQDKNYDPVVPESVDVVDWKSPLSPFDQGEIPADADVLKRIFRCELSGRPYRIIKQELDFYRKHNLPLPRKHPDVRHTERLAKRPGRSLHLRTCDCCSEEMLSVYAAGNQESRLQNQEKKRIYCEDCYQREVFG